MFKIFRGVFCDLTMSEYPLEVNEKDFLCLNEDSVHQSPGVRLGSVHWFTAWEFQYYMDSSTFSLTSRGTQALLNHKNLPGFEEISRSR